MNHGCTKFALPLRHPGGRWVEGLEPEKRWMGAGGCAPHCRNPSASCTFYKHPASVLASFHSKRRQMCPLPFCCLFTHLSSPPGSVHLEDTVFLSSASSVSTTGLMVPGVVCIVEGAAQRQRFIL